MVQLTEATKPLSAFKVFLRVFPGAHKFRCELYGRTRISTKSFFVHHTQHLAKAAVMYDARAILKRVTACAQASSNACLRTGTAAHAALASEWA